MNDSTAKDFDNLIKIGVKLAELYMNWFTWLMGINAGTMVVLASSLDRSPVPARMLGIVMSAANYLAILAGIAAAVTIVLASKRFRSVVIDSETVRFAVTNPLVVYAVVGTSIISAVSAVSWTFVAIALSDG